MKVVIKTSDSSSIKPFVEGFYVPPAETHKGQNGKLMIIGGSELFHAASLWAAETASHFVDMVHYSSTKENNDIFTKLKEIFRNGIVVPHAQIPAYVEEDDAILVGPGMVRNENEQSKNNIQKFEEIVHLSDEAEFSRELTHYLLTTYSNKRFVIDAGALQMMDAEWLTKLQVKPIITPHQLEFKRLFGIDVMEKSVEEKAEIVKEYAKRYNCIIVLKAVCDITSDGNNVYIIEGGNAGLTKGGSGDILAGLIASFYTKNEPLQSAVLASFVLKKSADELFSDMGQWYNMIDLIHKIPHILKKLLYN